MLPQVSGKTYPKEVCLNRIWQKPEEAKISVFDRGFMLGDSLYEVIPFYEGRVFALEEHLSRLKYCLKEISLDFDVEMLIPYIEDAVRRSDYASNDAAVYLQVSRGAAPRSHFFPEKSEPIFLLYSFPVNLRGFENKHWKLLISEDIRWHRCDIKTTSYLANTMLNDKSYKLGLDETLLVKEGIITEGSHSSAFFVQDEIIYTHPEGHQILSGITRKIVLDLCRNLGLELREEAFPFSEIAYADEVFLTGTTTQVMAISEIQFQDNILFQSSEPGPITRKIQEAFIQRTRNLQV
ncbi:D-alanine transaminase [Christiangramia gaetbulicola]|uniref:D-alanine transaminase n=1 Tax=Christiangramia gaetbulicola TaxID=703340 RepID=A0A2T6AF14_9FLAO|nr:aminotransferase class IV [Christiangramia gaetbulicola]PTX42408.1 D-alanine transaminase [Christiangramia gaetbulicola]